MGEGLWLRGVNSMLISFATILFLLSLWLRSLASIPLARRSTVTAIGNVVLNGAVSMLLSNAILTLIGVESGMTKWMANTIWLVLSGALWLSWSMNAPTQS